MTSCTIRGVLYAQILENDTDKKMEHDMETDIYTYIYIYEYTIISLHKDYMYETLGSCRMFSIQGMIARNLSD